MGKKEISGKKAEASKTEVAKLRAEIECLNQENKKQAYDMGERLKEITCLLAVSEKAQTAVSIQELAAEAAKQLVIGFQFPDITVAVVTLDDRQHSCVPEKEWRGLTWCLHSPLLVDNINRGKVEAFYKEEHPWLVPFEQNLLNGVAKVIAAWVGRHEAEKQIQAHSDELEKAVEEAEARVLKQQADILDLSTPVLALAEGVLAVPLIGTLDSFRTQDVMEKALTRLSEDKARVLVVDITGVPVVDTMVANHLLRMASAVRLMGGECVLTGISPATAKTIVHLGIDLSTLNTRATLAQGLNLALELIGHRRQAL